jgi:hypothetical protein
MIVYIIRWVYRPCLLAPVSSSLFLDLQALNSGNKTVFHFDTGLPIRLSVPLDTLLVKQWNLTFCMVDHPIEFAAAAI